MKHISIRFCYIFFEVTKENDDKTKRFVTNPSDFTLKRQFYDQQTHFPLCKFHNPLLCMCSIIIACV